MTTRVLLVDDNRDVLELVTDSLTTAGYEVLGRRSAEECLEQHDLGRELDAALVDLRLPGLSGAELCARLVAAQPLCPVIVITAHGSMNAAVEVLRAGASDFLVKPFELEHLRLTIERAISGKRLREEVQRLTKRLGALEGLAGIIGESGCMEDLKRQVRRIAPVDATTLIVGESGTGKELFARAIHAASVRKTGPFISVNCAAIPESLFESEFFGHVRGAFTGAQQARSGLFVEARGGTLFLDEIGELPAAQQGELLRALQERRIRPVGGNAEIDIDVRVVAATNRELEALVSEGAFRKDLYYRLKVLQLDVPPLRARGNDVLLLAQHVLRRAAEQMGRPVIGLMSATAERLLAHDWPGNVRELENCITRAVAFAEHDQLTPNDLPEHVRNVSAGTFAFAANDAGGQLTLHEVEDRYIQHVLQMVGGNKTVAARVLGIGRRTLHRKLSGESEGEDADEPAAP